MGCSGYLTFPLKIYEQDLIKQLLPLGGCGTFAFTYTIPSEWNAFFLFSAQLSLFSFETTSYPI